jgi:hypothetical protein
MSDAFLTGKQFCAVAPVERANLDQLRRRKQLPMAFGRDAPIAVDRYRPLDAAAFAFGNAITPTCGRKLAAAIIREFWDVWLDGIRLWEWWPRREGEKPPAIIFFVGKRLIPRREAYFVTTGTFEDVIEDLNGLPDARSPAPATHVIIGDVLAGLRSRARAAGIDLSAPFFPPPDHPDQAGLRRILSGIQEMSALREQVQNGPPPRRDISERAKRVELVWMN